MKYSEVIFNCTGGADWHRDLLIHDLADLGFDTFEPRNDGFAAYIAAEQLDVQAMEQLVIHQPLGFNVSYEIREIQPQNWNAVWESNFEPVVIDEQCYVRATFHPQRPDYRYEIVVDPKMAFGTGHHQTTSLMMRYLLLNPCEGKRVLDMGCGTGILAILAAKMGSSCVWAVDNDPVCVASVEENKVLNGVIGITTDCGSAEWIDGRQFDVILANINRNILLDQLDRYALAIPPAGELYISGFYDGGDLAILTDAAARHGFAYSGHQTLDNWAAAKFTKKQ